MYNEKAALLPTSLLVEIFPVDSTDVDARKFTCNLI